MNSRCKLAVFINLKCMLSFFKWRRKGILRCTVSYWRVQEEEFKFSSPNSLKNVNNQRVALCLQLAACKSEDICVCIYKRKIYIHIHTHTHTHPPRPRYTGLTVILLNYFLINLWNQDCQFSKTIWTNEYLYCIKKRCF